jgi:hypothetical protein
MSKQDLRRIEVLTKVLAGRRITVSSASFLNISVRQTQRLLKRYEVGGGAALIHKARGRTASNRINIGIRDYALELARENHRDFGLTLAAEALRERRGLEVHARHCVNEWASLDYGRQANSGEAFISVVESVSIDCLGAC